MPTKFILCLLALLGVANVPAAAHEHAPQGAEIGVSIGYATLVLDSARSGLEEAGIAPAKLVRINPLVRIHAYKIMGTQAQPFADTPVSRADLLRE